MRVMHDDQIDITLEQVAALVADQLPSLGGLGIAPVDGGGTVNAIYRIGDKVTARFPLRQGDPHRVRAQLQREALAAAEFRQASPVPAPEPLHIGEPGYGYPLPWTTQSWLPGATATPTLWEDSLRLAGDLAELLQQLRVWNTSDRRFQGQGRGGLLSDHDAWVGECIRRSEGLFDTEMARTMWSGFRQLSRDEPDVMCHTDLIPSNVLIDDGRLVGVLDAGGFQAADPALDLVAGWHLLAD